MEDLPLGRTAALVPEFAMNDLPLSRTLMMIQGVTKTHVKTLRQHSSCIENENMLYKGHPQNKFPTRPTASKPLIM